MAVDSNLKEVCELLLTATQKGLLTWERGAIKQIVHSKLGKTYFMINADEPTPSQKADGELHAWLISLDVRETASESIYHITVDGHEPQNRESVDLLREVWEAATANLKPASNDRLRPVVESLKLAIRAQATPA